MVYENPQFAWNINSEISYQLCQLMNRADQKILNGKITDAYYSWTRIRTKIDPNLTPDQKKDLDKLEQDCSKLIFDLNYKNTIGVREKIAKKLTEYERMLMGLLRTTGFLTDKKKKVMNF